MADKLAATLAVAAKEKGKQAQLPPKGNAEGGSTSGTQPPEQVALNDDIPPGLDDWELSEGGLPEGSTLSGCKALLDGPPEEEADPKKHKQTNTGKGNRGKPMAKA